jgi:hypothetical protein
MKIIDTATTPSTIRISDYSGFRPPAAVSPDARKIFETY